MLGPRNLPTSYHPRPAAAPSTGSTKRVYAVHPARNSALSGTKNSRLDTRPPGGAGGDVEDRAAGVFQLPDQPPAPAAVAAEGEQLGEHVVPLRQRPEQ